MLNNVKVLELTQIVAGPFAGTLLADLGADVVRIEKPGSGDAFRQWGPFVERPNGDEYSVTFAAINRNKRSVELDITIPDDRDRVLALCREADVVVENFRPGVAKKYGLDYATVREHNSKIVYCSVTGFGQSGPYASRGAFDVTIQAMSGLMSVTGEEGSGPVKCGVPVADFCAALYAAYAIAACLLRVRETGVGGHIDCAMLASLLSISALQAGQYFGTGRSPGRMGSAHPRNAPYQAFKASDKYFVIAAGTDNLWRRVCEVVGKTDLSADERFTTVSLRAENQSELARILSAIFVEHAAAYWLKKFDAAGVPNAPLNDFAEVLSDPHVAERGWVVDLPMGDGVLTRAIPFPLSISGFTFGINRLPAEVGEHTAEVFREWLGQ